MVLTSICLPPKRSNLFLGFLTRDISNSLQESLELSTIYSGFLFTSRQKNGDKD